MPRRKYIASSHFPYHVTGRTNNREWFQLPMPEVWRIFGWMLARVSSKYEAQIISFVLMSNHYHLILKTPLANLGTIMNYLQREVSRAIGPRTERINHLFGGPYKATLLPNSRAVAHAYKYVYRNPVTAGICMDVREYEFSTLKSLLDGGEPFPLYDSFVSEDKSVPLEWTARLRWLNTPPTAQQYDLIRKGLRRSSFQLTKDRNMRHVVSSLEAY